MSFILMLTIMLISILTIGTVFTVFGDRMLKQA